MRRLVLMAALLVAAPAAAKWQTGSAAVNAAARQPDIAAVLAAINRIDDAVVAQDRAAFVGAAAADLVVNNPGNGVNDAAGLAANYDRGGIDYSSYVRNIELIVRRPSGEVVAMGEETVQPRNKAPLAGKTVRRRFTDVWRNDGGTWKLAVRQSTVFEVK